MPPIPSYLKEWEKELIATIYWVLVLFRASSSWNPPLLHPAQLAVATVYAFLTPQAPTSLPLPPGGGPNIRTPGPSFLSSAFDWAQKAKGSLTSYPFWPKSQGQILSQRPERPAMISTNPDAFYILIEPSGNNTVFSQGFANRGCHKSKHHPTDSHSTVEDLGRTENIVG